jgi:predicted GH43/DUF377 family glycosyl hydrolase
MWDRARVGAGCSPIKTEKGWLEIYHGANYEHQYCLGAFLLDLNDPYKVIARTEEPIMVPSEPYELTGFFGHVVFTNGISSKMMATPLRCTMALPMNMFAGPGFR